MEGSELTVASGALACDVLLVARPQEDHGMVGTSCDIRDRQTVQDSWGTGRSTVTLSTVVNLTRAKVHGNPQRCISFARSCQRARSMIRAAKGFGVDTGIRSYDACHFES